MAYGELTRCTYRPSPEAAQYSASALGEGKEESLVLSFTRDRCCGPWDRSDVGNAEVMPRKTLDSPSRNLILPEVMLDYCR